MKNSQSCRGHISSKLKKHDCHFSSVYHSFLIKTAGLSKMQAFLLTCGTVNDWLIAFLGVAIAPCQGVRDTLESDSMWSSF